MDKQGVYVTGPLISNVCIICRFTEIYSFNTCHIRLFLILLVKKISIDSNLFQILGIRRQKFRSIWYISNYTFTDSFTDWSIPCI